MAVNQLNYFEHQQGAGWNSFPDRTTERFIAHNDPEVRTRSITVASGQVLKARSWVESNTAGKMVAHGTIAETAQLTFNSALVSTNTVVISITGAAASITFTVGTAGATAAQLTTAISVLTSGITTTNANIALLAAGIPTTVGTYTAMTVGAPAFVYSVIDTDTLEIYSPTMLTDVTTLTVASTGTVHTLTTTAGTTTFNKPAGFLAFDVDATSADTSATIYTAGSFWEDALVWAVDPLVDVLTKADATTVACTAYNTGAFSSLARQKFVEGLPIELVPIKAGEFM